MWSDGLAAWYAVNGRHHLPWRRTREPWPVLVSEVMLQQTPVARVQPRWERFVARWPRPEDCAAQTLDVVLREWDGLGYPRRARALWETAGLVSVQGWPPDETGLRALPGVGTYTARALLVFALGADDTPPPRDVNLGRVAARAGLGVEVEECTPRRLDTELIGARPHDMDARDYAFALFDIGATTCLARRRRCDACPLHACRSRHRVDRVVAGRARRQPRYRGSLRELRGAILRALLDGDAPRNVEELSLRVAHVPASARPEGLSRALAGLVDDGLIPSCWRPAP